SVSPQRVIAYLSTAVRSLTEALEVAPDRAAVSLSILPEDERRQVTDGFNPVSSYPQDELIQELFEGRVRLHPDATAVVCEGESLTYRQLNDRANQLAWFLRKKGVGPDQLVGICVERSLEMVVG